MPIKVLIIAIIENAKGEILMRKKPDGSPPYVETWYLFGAELVPGEPINETLRKHIATQTGIETTTVEELGWDTEVKADIDGTVKQFVYLDMKSQYVSGDLRLSPGIEKLAWIPKEELTKYDLVPPSKILFKKLGFIA